MSSPRLESSNSGLGKLLPKSMAKRRRKLRSGKDAGDDGLRPMSREMSLESDDARSNADEEEDMDDRSFGSYESGGADADQDSSSRSRPPQTRPTTISPHPSQSDLRSPMRIVNQRAVSRTMSRESLNDAAPILEPPPLVRTASPDKKLNRVPPPRISTHPPRTPPADDQPAPVIMSTPPTPPLKARQIASGSPERRAPRNVSQPAPNGDVSRVGGGHRRTKSGSSTVGPSKLSNITAAPLSPTPENAEMATPSSAGFFSTMFSAAQNAASTISNSTGIGIGGSGGGNKSRANTLKSQPSPAVSQIEIEPPTPDSEVNEGMGKKESAIRTLGSGELSLDQLGIGEPSGFMMSPENSRFPDLSDTRARSESAPADSQTRSPDFIPEESTSRPRSLYESPTAEQDQGISQIDLIDSKVEMQRSASSRSDSKPHRKRGSSVTTTTTIAPTIPAVGSSASQANLAVGAPKLTGFAIASKKRNRDFHSLFKSVPDDDYLIEDYSCALQREILAHGRLYVSEGHLCFSSNILGWTTTLVMSFDEIVSVEKRSTALVFKNGLMISTLHAKHIFASFTSRDATYDLIVNIWKLGHPTLKSTLNGVQVEGTGGDKTEKIDAEPVGLDLDAQLGSDSQGDSDEDEDEDFYDEEESEQLPETQATSLVGPDGNGIKNTSRKVSGATIPNGAQLDIPQDASGLGSDAGSFPGPATHAPTDCGDSATHYEKIVGDEIIAAPLGKVYNLLFGAGSPKWMGDWISGEQKCLELQMEDQKGLSLENKTRVFSYIKPLYASIGPKQTKCIVTETLDNLDFEKAVNLSVTTQNPDVPAGNIFRVKTKYCLSWAENNSTRVQVNCTTEWSGKSWLKGPIEKNVNEGQGQYCKDLFVSLKAAVSSRPRSSTLASGGARPKKKGKKGKAQLASVDAADIAAKPKIADKDWGVLEPIRGVAEPIVDLIKPVLTGNVVYGLLVGLLVATWFGFGLTPNRSGSAYGPDLNLYNPYRLAGYEEMWRKEESELWAWLDERVGLDRLSADVPNARKKVVEPRTFEEKLRDQRMDEREVQEAIRVTEEKLRVLREVMARTSQRG